jgi:hypothetical protein
VEYVQDVRSLWSLARRHGFDVLIALLAIEAMLEVAVRRDSPDAPGTTLWFDVPAIAIMVLPLFARRRFPFAAVDSRPLWPTSYGWPAGPSTTRRSWLIVHLTG